jgi:hypothetical protein
VMDLTARRLSLRDLLCAMSRVRVQIPMTMVWLGGIPSAA